MDKFEQIEAMTLAAVREVKVEITCGQCATTFEDSFSITNASTAAYYTADQAWDCGWEVHDTEILCPDCTPEVEAEDARPALAREVR